MKNVADIWPLAPLQEMMLAHALSGQDPELLVEQFQCSLEGALDVAALRRAWEFVFDRHALLRSAPAWEGLKRPVQVVRRTVELPWVVYDWRELNVPAQCDSWEALRAETRRQGFGLARPPLSRFHLVQLADDAWKFLWTCHHLVLDGWSLGIVLREVFECYETFQRQQSATLEPCGTFADYLTWLKSQDRSQADQFWRQQVGDAAGRGRRPVIIEAAPPERHEGGHAECETRLSPDETMGLNRAALAWRVSPSSLVEAAWAILLARYSAQDEIVMGVAVSGRPSDVPRIDTIVGPLMNNIPLRVRVGLDEPVAEICRRLCAAHAEAQPQEYCSTESIAAAVGSVGRSLFDTLVVYENYPLHTADRWQAGNVTVRDMHGTTTAGYPVSLVALPGGELGLRLLYDTRYYSAAAAEGLLAQVATLLRAMACRPESRVRELSLAAQGEFVPQNGAAECELALRVLDSAGQLAPVGLAGELWVEVSAEESRDHRASSLNSSIADPLDPAGRRRLRRTNYRAVWLADGALEYLGPDSETRSIVRAGAYSIAAEEVVAVVMLHPLVTEATVIEFVDQMGMSQLAAYIVVSVAGQLGIDSSRGELVLAEVRRHATERLPAALVPAVWNAIESVPLDAAGRVIVSALPRPLRPRGEGSQPYLAPRSELEARIARIWSQVLGVEPVGVTDNFLDLGGNSGLALSLVTRLADEFGRKVPLAALLTEPTVAHLAAVLGGESRTGASRTLVPLRSESRGAPLFCVHPAGGTVFCYRELALRLQSDVPVYGLQARGIDGVQAAQETIEAMAADYVLAIEEVQPIGPYRLCGWSTGGVVAFEIARQLTAAGKTVSLVALLDAAIPDPDNPLGEDDLAPLLAMMLPGEDPEQLRQLRERPLAEQVDYFRQRAEATKVLLAGTDGGGAQAVFDVFEANMRAVVAYQPSPLSVPLALLCATEHATPMHADPLLGWGRWATGGTEVFSISGTHLELLAQPAVVEVANILDQLLGHCSEGPATAAPAEVQV